MQIQAILLSKITFLELTIVISAFGGEISAGSMNCSQVNVIHQDLHCDGPGKFPLKDSCAFYYECVHALIQAHGDGTSDSDDTERYLLVKVRCPEGTHFDGVDCVQKNLTEKDCPLILCPVLGDFSNVPTVEDLDLGTANVTNATNYSEIGCDNTTSTDENDVMLGDDPGAPFHQPGVYKSKFKPEDIQETTPESQSGIHPSTSTSTPPKPERGQDDHHHHSHGHGHGHGHSHGKRKVVKNGGSNVLMLNVLPQMIAALLWLVSAF